MALRKAHPGYGAAEVEAVLLANSGDVNATAAALVLGADTRAEVRSDPAFQWVSRRHAPALS